MRCNFNHKRRRGTALLLAIAVTMLLFIIGFAFLSNTQSNRQTVQGLDRAATIDDGIDAVIAQINKVLVEDLVSPGGDGIYGTIDDGLLDGSADNEYYDYPGPDDPWLASLEPEYSNSTPGFEFYYWRHLSDIYGNNFGGIPTSPEPLYYDPDDDSDNRQQDSGQLVTSWWFWATNFTEVPDFPHKYTVAKIVDEANDRVGLLKDSSNTDPVWPDVWDWGARADADGDGVADSRFVKIPDITGSNGENVYVAVRIIDNCGMINVNTAYRIPNVNSDFAYMAPGQLGDWDGTLLTHVNLEGIISSTDYVNSLNGINIQQARFGDVINTAGPPKYLNFDWYDNDKKYHEFVARRLLNPAIILDGSNERWFSPFDLMDEIELRNRNFLTSNVVGRLGYTDGGSVNIWPVTFDPGAGSVGRENPYGANATDTVAGWFNKVNHEWDPANPTAEIFYNRRHISTTYSFDRVMAPRPATWPPTNPDAMPGELVTAWNTWNKWDNANSLLWEYKPVSIIDVVKGTQPIELLAGAIWLGLPDTSKTAVDPAFNFDLVPPGLSKGVTPKPYSAKPLTRTDIACQLAVNLVDYIDNNTISTELDVTDSGSTIRYYGFEPEKPLAFISEFAKAEVIAVSGTEYAYAIELYNPGSTIVSLAGWELDIVGTTVSLSGTVPAGGTLVLHDSTDTTTVDPESVFSITGEPISGIATAGPPGGVPSIVGDRITLLDADSFPVDALEFTVLPSFSASLGTDDLQYFERGDWIIDDAMPVWDTDPGTTWTSTSISGLDDFTPTTPTIVNPVTPTIVHKISLTGRDNNKLPTVGEMVSVLALGASREGVSPPHKYKTIPEWFDAFSNATRTKLSRITDGRIEVGHEDFQNVFRYLTVDNFDPFADGIDNDGDGFNDDADIVEPELDIAGRININTAPWFVIAQLPWIQDPTVASDHENKFKLAQAIVAYRDKLNLRLSFDPDGPDYSLRGLETGIIGVREEPGFASVGELVNVTKTTGDVEYDIRKLAKDSDNDDLLTTVGPFYSPKSDTVPDDLDERDVFFQRISNLATVRSDVFTAYILVRVGEFGPQKRVIAIFDRSNVYSAGDTPKLVALHPVPDPG